MNRYQRRQNLRAMRSNGKLEDPNRNVTRQELVEAVDQMGENVGLVQQGLVEAVNTMYGVQVFPFQMELWAIEQLCIDKGIFTEEELNVKLDQRRKELLDKAKAIKEGEDGKIELMSESEEKKAVKKAVKKAKSNK